MKKLILILPLLIAGCDDSQPMHEGPITKWGGNVYLKTLDHDGHRFVVMVSQNDVGGITHHPSCPCIKQ
jgi:hypothetical protein